MDRTWRCTWSCMDVEGGRWRLFDLQPGLWVLEKLDGAVCSKKCRVFMCLLPVHFFLARLKFEQLELCCSPFFPFSNKDYAHKHSILLLLVRNCSIISKNGKCFADEKNVTFKGLITQSSICQRKWFLVNSEVNLDLCSIFSPPVSRPKYFYLYHYL